LIQYTRDWGLGIVGIDLPPSLPYNLEMQGENKLTKLPKEESVTVEFKNTFNEEAIETLVAFSNAKGGTVYVGVSDKGKVQGITVGKETIPNWINEIKSKTSPQIIPDAEMLTLENKTAR